MKYFAALVSWLSGVVIAIASTVTLPIGQVNVDIYPLLNAHSASEYQDLRADLVQFVWKGAGVPTSLLPSWEGAYNHAKPAWVAPVGVTMRAAHARDPITTDVYSVIYLLEAPTDNDCLFVHNFSHGSGLVAGAAVTQGERNHINARLADGCDVVVLGMPFNGDNAIITTTIPYASYPNPGYNALHDFFEAYETSDSTPIRYFLNPPIIGTNWAINRHGGYGRIGISGLSGGGLVSTFVAALDTRITHSYTIAGTMPMHMRNHKPGDVGDWEQSGSAWLDIADYMDLYILGALEPGRRSMQLFNLHDGCCFSGDQSYAFSNQLKGIASRMGVDGLGFYVSDTSGHEVSAPSMLQISIDFAQ